MKIHAPNKEYTGTVAGVAFANGVADVDEDQHGAAMAYFRRKGYGIGRPVKSPEDAPVPGPVAAPIDPRFASPQQLGSPLRDAAVDPRPNDFLPPTNAGQANPHGPDVVAPGIHAAPPAPIVAGPVPSDAELQAERETAAAQAVLVEDGDPGAAAAAGEAPNPSDIGPDAAGATRSDVEPVDRPAKSANKAAWVHYAVAHGVDRDEAEDLTIAQLQERFPEPDGND